MACRYISHDGWQDLELKAEEVGKLLNDMIENPEKYRRASDAKKILKKSNKRRNDSEPATEQSPARTCQNEMNQDTRKVQ